jgi:hypothetical protein
MAQSPPLVVILGSLLGIAQDLVGGLYGLELGDIFHLFARVAIRMIQSCW